jgi:hypothetical protein
MSIPIGSVGFAYPYTGLVYFFSPSGVALSTRPLSGVSYLGASGAASIGSTFSTYSAQVDGAVWDGATAVIVGSPITFTSSLLFDSVKAGGTNYFWGDINYNGTKYVAQLKKVTPAAVDAQTWTLPDGGIDNSFAGNHPLDNILNGFAISPDETIAYWSCRNQVGWAKVGGVYVLRRWSLSGSTALANLATDATLSPYAFITLTDGTLVSAWQDTSVSSTVAYIRLYSQAGALLTSYTLVGGIFGGVRMWPGLTDATYWYNPVPSATFTEVDALTGATINSFTCPIPSPSTSVDNLGSPFVTRVQIGGACSDGGDVTVVADPADGTPFSGRQLNPRAMLEIGFDDATRYYSNDALNTPTRRHRGSVIQFGTITRQLSDRTSPYKVADCQVDVDDSDRHLSILEATAASEHWQNREAKVTVQNLDSLALDETPHTLGRFIWRKHLSSGLQRTIGLTDVLGSEFSDFNLERMLPTRQVKDDFPSAPPDSLERAVPIALGIFPDQNGNAIDSSPVTNVVLTADARAAAPTNPTATLTAGGSFTSYGWTEYYAVAAIVGGVMSDLAYMGPITTDAANRSALLTWDLYAGADAILLFSAVRSDFAQFAVVYLAGNATSYDDQYVLPNQDGEWIYPNSPWYLDWRTDYVWYVQALLSDGTYTNATPSNTLHQWPFTRPYNVLNMTVTWDAHASAVGYRLTRGVQLYGWGFNFDLQIDVGVSTLSYDDVGHSHEQLFLAGSQYLPPPVSGGALTTNDVIPAIALGSLTISGTTYRAGLVCGHAINHVEGMSYSLPTVTGDVNTPPGYASVQSAEWGVEWFAPGQAGWPLGTNYHIVNGHWYTVVLKAHEPWPDTVLVSCCAMEDVGDGTGNTIDGAARQLFQLLQQFWLPPSDEAWTNGAWLAPRTFTDGTPIFNTQSIADLETIEVNRIGRYYRGQIYLDEPISLRTFLERFFVSFGMRFGQNQHGQVIAVHLDDFADLSSAIALTDVRDLVAETSMDRSLEQMENRIVYDYGYRPTLTGQFLKQAQRMEDATAIGFESTGSPAMATGNRGRVAQGERRQMFYVDDPVTTLDVVARDLAFGKYPPRYCAITCTLHAVIVTLGSIVVVTDFEGIGATGWTNRPLWVLGIETTLGDQQTDPTVRLTCVDVLRVLNGVGEWALDTVANWNVATDDEQAANLYWADASDQMSDGSLGKVWG